MTAFDVLRNAGGAILFHRLRSFLTMLGIVIGVASVILLTSIGVATIFSATGFASFCGWRSRTCGSRC